MGVVVVKGLVAQIVALADACRDEVCGLLFGSDDRITGYRPCSNVAVDPRIAFEIDPAQLLAAHRAARTGGPRVIGHYHSHPSGRAVPSPRDAAAAMPDGALWLIAASGNAALYRAVTAGAIEGRFDPVAFTDAHAGLCARAGFAREATDSRGIA